MIINANYKCEKQCVIDPTTSTLGCRLNKTKIQTSNQKRRANNQKRKI